MLHTALGAVLGTYSGPPAPSAPRMLTLWQFDPVADVALALVAAVYLYGVLLLRRRGDKWPVQRTALFLGGVAVVAYAISGPPGVYDDTLFSIHMVQHMLLSMVAPIGFALGAPVTLALRTLPPRPRGWVLAGVHSKVARVLGFPLTGLAVMTGTLVVYLFTSLYAYSESHLWFHELTHVWFLLAGCAFFWPLIGLDPIPHRAPHWARLFTFILVLPVHAFIGLALMSSTHAIDAAYYLGLHRPWGATPLSDQHTGGGILWAAGDPIALTMAIILMVQWMRADERTARREDRARDRAETELAAAELRWNAQFAELARRDGG